MTRFPLLRLSCMSLMLVLLAGCATGPRTEPVPGAMPSPRELQIFQGELENVDHGNGRLLLRDDAEGGRALDMGYDRFTRLSVDGQLHPVAGLEPGDRVRVEVQRSERGWRADTIQLLADARAPVTQASGTVQISGVVSAIDTTARTLTLTEGGVTGGVRKLGYDQDTRIERQGKPGAVTDLRRGDMLHIQARQDDGRLQAIDIRVPASDGGQ